MLASLMKFKSALDAQKAHADNSLPEFYKNVICQLNINYFDTHFPGAEMGLIHLDLLCRVLLSAHLASHRLEPGLASNASLQLPRLHGNESKNVSRQSSLM